MILPTMTSCLECQLDMHAPRPAVPLCTIAAVPRQPQHCIEWAHIIGWSEERKGVDKATSILPTMALMYHQKTPLTLTTQSTSAGSSRKRWHEPSSSRSLA